MKKSHLVYFITLLLVLSMTTIIFGHPGKIDSKGGHNDTINASGLGSYHYHHGYDAHLHTNGVCPYDFAVPVTASASTPNSTKVPNNTAVVSEYYKEFPGVPNFGYVIGAEADKIYQENNAYVYQYDNANIDYEETVEYGKKLAANGFIDYEEIENGLIIKNQEIMISTKQSNGLTLITIEYLENDGNKTQEWEKYYKTDTYSKYLTPASENKLDGTLLKVQGTVDKCLTVGDYYAYIISKDKEEWLLMSANDTKVNVGDKIIGYGMYQGVSSAYNNMPAIFLYRIKNNSNIFNIKINNLAIAGLYEGRSFEDLHADLHKDEKENTPVQKQISVKVNNETIAFDQPPENINGRIMVPIRYVVEKMDCAVEWDSTTETVYINQANTPVIKNAQKTSNINVYVNNNIVAFDDQQPVNKNGRILIPVRYVTEKLGYTVNWDPESQLVGIFNADNRTAYIENVSEKEEKPIEAPKPKVSFNNKNDILNYLIDNYSVVKTSQGDCRLEFSVMEKFSDSMQFDYSIKAEIESRFYYKNVSIIAEISDSSKEKVMNELKNHMELIAKDIIGKVPNKKIDGCYDNSYYKYPNIKEGYVSRNYNSWSNYIYDLYAKYNQTQATNELYWNTSLDDN